MCFKSSNQPHYQFHAQVDHIGEGLLYWIAKKNKILHQKNWQATPTNTAKEDINQKRLKISSF